MNGLNLRGHLMTTMSIIAYVALTPFGAKAEGDTTLLAASMAGIADKAGAAERVEISASLRTLSQKSASAACHLHNGIASDKSKYLLDKVHRDFALYLRSLIYGNKDLNIFGREADRRTLAELIKVSDLWDPLSTAIEALLDDPDDEEAFALIRKQNIPLHDASALLLSQIIGVYSHPIELLQADALLIQFSGRQAALTQKLAKEACEIWAGNASAELLDGFTNTMSLYEATLYALYDGMPAVGIIPAPTKDIRAALELEILRWQTVKADLLILKQSNNIEQRVRENIYRTLNDAMYASKNIAKMYVKLAHQNGT